MSFFLASVFRLLNFQRLAFLSAKICVQILKYPKIFLDSRIRFMVKNFIMNPRIESDQPINFEFGCGFFFYWFYWVGVCPPPGS